jgi:hypothetical protein
VLEGVVRTALANPGRPVRGEDGGMVTDREPCDTRTTDHMHPPRAFPERCAIIMGHVPCQWHGPNGGPLAVLSARGPPTKLVLYVRSTSGTSRTLRTVNNSIATGRMVNPLEEVANEE